MTKRRRTTRTRTTRTRTTRTRTTKTKSRIAGFTRVKGKYALVFKKGKKLSIGKGRYRTKSSMLSSAKRFLR